MKNQIGYMIFFASVVVACWAMRTTLDTEAVAETRVVTSVADLAVPMVKSVSVAGLSIGIVSKNESGEWTAQTQHFGNVAAPEAPENERLPTDDTLYEIGGVTNVFTGILLAMAVERGEVSLDTPAADLMPPGITMPDFGEQKIFLIDMVTHRSGLPRLADNMPRSIKDDPYHDYTSELAGEFLNRHKLTRAPGSKYEYSNFAMSYLGHLLTVKSGHESYDALLADRLTGPLEMKSTTVMLAEQDSKVAIGHTANGAAARPWRNADMPGAGGVRSTIADMNRFMIANMKSRHGAVGKALDLAFEQHRKPIDREYGMGLGWLISRHSPTRFHNGQTGGFHAAMLVNRELNIGVCVLSNTASGDVDKLASQLFRWKAGSQATVPVTAISRRDGEGYPRLSPFTAVRWQGEVPEVQVAQKWYELVSMNDVATNDILVFSKRTFGRQWQKRFEEDLVELLTRMGHPPKDTVQLAMKAADSDKITTLKNVAMTRENRNIIYAAARARER